jgi:RNA polymerase sigma-70 factor, ECF subfamily
VEHIPFEILVEEYQHKVFHTCFVMLRNREDAEDAAQEVFVELHRSLEKFKGEASMSTWIYRITLNRCTDHLRMKGRKKRNLFAFKATSNSDMERLSIAGDSNPHQDLEISERHKLLYDAVDSLPNRQRIAFNLAKLEGLPQEKVAEIMETSVSSVESLLVRAKKQLKQLLLKHSSDLF